MPLSSNCPLSPFELISTSGSVHFLVKYELATPRLPVVPRCPAKLLKRYIFNLGRPPGGDPVTSAAPLAPGLRHRSAGEIQPALRLGGSIPSASSCTSFKRTFKKKKLSAALCFSFLFLLPFLLGRRTARLSVDASSRQPAGGTSLVVRRRK